MSQRAITHKFWMAGVACIGLAAAQPRAIDTARSSMTVHVSKSGVLSALGHNHEISAPLAGGSVDAAARKVELHVKTASMQVKDAGVSDKDRTQIQTTMLGPEVLDAERHPEIAFRSTGAQPAGSGAWKLQGNLTLHGQSHPVTVDVREVDGRYQGSALVKQTEFGIKPVKAGGGTVRVKDEVRIDFDIELAR